jgi:hypothetical protein
MTARGASRVGVVAAESLCVARRDRRMRGRVRGRRASWRSFFVAVIGLGWLVPLRLFGPEVYVEPLAVLVWVLLD